MKKTNVVNVVKAIVKGIRLARLYGGRLDGILFSSDWKHIQDVYDIKRDNTVIRVNCNDSLWRVLVIINGIPEEVVHEIPLF